MTQKGGGGLPNGWGPRHRQLPALTVPLLSTSFPDRYHPMAAVPFASVFDQPALIAAMQALSPRDWAGLLHPLATPLLPLILLRRHTLLF